MIQSLNRDITNEKINRPYPHIDLLELSDNVALVVPSLPEGDLPVLCTYKGTTRQIGSIQKSATTLNVLRKISPIDCHISKDKCIKLNGIDSIFQAIEEML